MTAFARQFQGHAPRSEIIPKPPPNPAGRPPDSLSDHERGKVGSLHAIAREMGVTPNTLHMMKRNRADFPAPIAGHVYAVDDIRKLREV